MRIAVIAACGVGDFGPAFARAGADVAFVDRGTHPTVTQPSGVKPGRRTNAVIEPGCPSSVILTALNPYASNASA